MGHYPFGFSHAYHPGHAFGSDDAYIAYRYSQNLAAGHGLVYNPVEHNKFDQDYIFARSPELISARGSPQLDMTWGITHQRYRAEGYRLKYLVTALEDSKPENIVDVSEFSDFEISNLFNEGCQYFVISEQP